MAIKILLDAGHGAGSAHNRGSVCSNEGDNNFRYSLVLKRELEKKGFIVGLTRNKITDNPSLVQRGAMGAGYDVLISLHSNGATASVRGTEIFDSVRKPNKALATKLVNEISRLFKHNNRGVKYKAGQPGWDWYGVLRNSSAKSAMIIEHGFHTNKTDCNYFKNNHLTIARNTANILASHYGVSGGTNTGSKVYYGIGSPYNNKKDVQKLQQDLVKAGFSVGSWGTNGIMGKDTSNAIKAFQKKHGLKVDGFAGKDTLLRLEQVLTPPKPNKPVPPVKKYYKVQTGAYSQRSNANNLVKQLKAKGFDAFVTKIGKYYKVQTGAYSKRNNADELVKRLKKAGFDAFVVYE